MVKLDKNGYGQIELNRVNFINTGAIEAQYALDPTEFAAIPAENGMLFIVDNGDEVAKKATANATPVLVNFTAERNPELSNPRLRDFAILPGQKQIPRLGYLTAGDVITTNTVQFDTATNADFDAWVEAGETAPVYGVPASDGTGYWELVAAIPATGMYAEVQKFTTMPDGQPAVMFVVVRA